jgi:DNA-directed RNA polymerase subunit RPC12/RpoP
MLMDVRNRRPAGPAASHVQGARRTIVEPEITFIVAYRCPQCQAELEARSGLAQGWVRCPKCGRACLPPEHMRVPLGARTATVKTTTVGAGEEDDVLVIGPGSDIRFLTPVETVVPAPTTVSGRSAFFAAGCFLSFFLLLISLLDQNSTNTTIFAVLSLIFPILWAIPVFRRR